MEEVSTAVSDVVSSVEAKKIRNYSFAHKNPEYFDIVEAKDTTYYIPAAVGSTYWAIIKTLFMNFGERIYKQELADQVEEIMQERDDAKWQKYKNKKKVVTYLKTKNQLIEKEATDWKDRIFNNAVLLTRGGKNSPYGLRLTEMGYRIIQDKDSLGSFFVMEKVQK